MKQPKVHRAVGLFDVVASFEPKSDLLVKFSVTHLLSAHSFAGRVRQLEEENTGKKFGEFWDAIFANATATIFTSIAALESYANELFIDHEKIFPGFKPDLMAKLWELCEQKSPLEKLEFAIALRLNGNLDRGGKRYQDVRALVKLRNGLTHFKPEWLSEQKEHAKISAILKHRAILSPFLRPTEPLFPRGWASHKTTVWAMRSVFDFIVTFEQQAGFDARMIKFAPLFPLLGGRPVEGDKKGT